jgi:hypothetical protein
VSSIATRIEKNEVLRRVEGQRPETGEE